MKRARTSHFINNRSITKKEFLNARKDEIQADFVRQQFLVDNNLLSPSEIRKYEKLKILVPTKFKGGKYFKKSDVSAVFEKNTNPNMRLKL